MIDIYDFTLHALDRRLCTALGDGDWARARILTTVLGMYTKDILDVQWEDGEPIFQLTKKGEGIADDVTSALEKLGEEYETETQEK